MTLLLVLAAPWAIHQSSDYRLTSLNPTQMPGPDDMAGSKQLTVNSTGFVAQICFTGVAQVGSLKTRDWISEIVAQAAEPIDIKQVVSEIAVRGTKAVNSVPASHRMLTVLVAIAEHGKNPRLAMVSNIDRLDGSRRAKSLDRLEVSFLTPIRPMVFSFGCDIGLSRADKRHLLNLLRKTQDSNRIKEALGSVNKLVAQSPQSGGMISEGCMVSSLFADGTSSAINFGEVPGIPDSFMGSFNVGDLLRKNLRAAPGKQITMVQSAGASRDGIRRVR
jgi:hypothetical protein